MLASNCKRYFNVLSVIREYSLKLTLRDQIDDSVIIQNYHICSFQNKMMKPKMKSNIFNFFRHKLLALS